MWCVCVCVWCVCVCVCVFVCLCAYDVYLFLPLVSRSFSLLVENLNGKNHTLAVTLGDEIVPEKSTFKVCTQAVGLHFDSLSLSISLSLSLSLSSLSLSLRR